MNNPLIITHSGPFHADDVFAVAVLKQLYPNATLERTRDVERFAVGDIVLDVGGVYDPETKRFDHHQTGGAGARDNGVPYSSLGLVWKHFGEELAGSKEVWEEIDEHLIQSIDAIDNGVPITTPNELGVRSHTPDQTVKVFRPTWKEQDAGKTFDEGFADALAVAAKIFERELVCARDKIAARAYVEAAYDQAPDRRVIMLDRSVPHKDVLMNYPEPLFVVRPRTETHDWGIDAIPLEGKDFKNRKDFPKAWAGKRDEELAQITGVSDAIFCHNGLWVAAARTREGALALARLALENPEE